MIKNKKLERNIPGVPGEDPPLYAGKVGLGEAVTNGLKSAPTGAWDEDVAWKKKGKQCRHNIWKKDAIVFEVTTFFKKIFMCYHDFLETLNIYIVTDFNFKATVYTCV